MYDADLTHGAQLSLWLQNVSPEDAATLATDVGDWPSQPLDLIVVGGGISGLSTAYHACAQGMSVLVLEKGLLASGETGRTSAHIANALDDHFYLLEQRLGKNGARLAAESHHAALEDIEQIARTEGIECKFRRVPGYLVPKSASRRDRREIGRELKAAKRAGLRVEQRPSPLPSLSDQACLRFEDQAEFEPVAYIAGLARAIARMGGRIRTRCKVADIESSASEQIVRLDDDRRLTAKALVVATNSPINDRFSMHTKQAAYRTYMLALAIPKGALERALYWDTGDPYHYVRLTGDDDVLLVGGEDHKVGQSSEPESHWTELERWTRQHFPMVQEVRSRWSGQIQEPSDGMAYIGKNPASTGDVFVVTGDSGNGITHGAIAGLMLPELIRGRSHAWERLYDPRRMYRAARTLDFVRENINVALHYMQNFQPRPHETNGVKPGQGTLIRRGLRPVAVYVDANGQRHECSAICPHLGCTVQWNSAERSWDCPCHGSRFDAYGKVMTGPARSDLVPLSASPRRPSDTPRTERTGDRPAELRDAD